MRGTDGYDFDSYLRNFCNRCRQFLLINPDTEALSQ